MAIGSSFRRRLCGTVALALWLGWTAVGLCHRTPAGPGLPGQSPPAFQGCLAPRAPAAVPDSP